MTEKTEVIPDDHATPFHQQLQQLVIDDIVEAAVLCSVDGLPITRTSRTDIPEDAISAMTASLMALADSMVGQLAGRSGGTSAEETTCRQVVIESADRSIVLVHAGNNMVLAVAGRPGMNLGMVVGHARRTVEHILGAMSETNDRKNETANTPAGATSARELVQQALKQMEENRQ